MPLAALTVTLLATSLAPTADVEAELRALQLDPPMLFPTALPARLRDADAELSTDSGVVVSWDRGEAGGNRVGEMTLSRGSRSQLAQDLRTSRSRGYRPRRTKLGSRTVWRLCGHVCGYEWSEQGRTYGVFGQYYVGDEDGQTVARDARALIKRLAPLR